MTRIYTVSPLAYLNHRLSWDKKLRIAFLAMITFAALC